MLTEVALMLLLGLFDPECADGMLGRAHTVFPDFERWLWGNMVQMEQIEVPGLSLLSLGGTQPLHLCLYFQICKCLDNNRRFWRT